MDDLISRAAVVDTIEDVDWYHINKNGEMVHGANDAEHQAWYKADDIYAAIERVPSAQQWIPCSERLPEDEQPILFSTTTGRVHQGRFHMDNSINRWYSSLDKIRAYNNTVNAWMPLPEPYERRQE